jgi:decaprenyl-phosphate phosphoribosyltransferase
MKTIFRLFRVQQYVKNLFIYLPLFFGVVITDIPIFLRTLLAASLFCLATSSVYILNDLLDIEVDRKHPLKKNRPLAAGEISKTVAIILMIVLAVFALTGAYLLKTQIVAIFLAYIIMNVLYSTVLKHIALIDVTIIAIGFILRLMVGSSISGVHLSIWIILMTFLLALFIALAKRREDVFLYLQNSEITRKIVDGYNLEFLNIAMIIMAAVLIIAYIMYTISPEILARPRGHETYLTVILVILGILRYLQLSIVFNNSGSPTKVVLKDRFLQLIIVIWIVTFWLLIY